MQLLCTDLPVYLWTLYVSPNQKYCNCAWDEWKIPNFNQITKVHDSIWKTLRFINATALLQAYDWISWMCIIAFSIESLFSLAVHLCIDWTQAQHHSRPNVFLVPLLKLANFSFWVRKLLNLYCHRRTYFRVLQTLLKYQSSRAAKAA